MSEIQELREAVEALTARVVLLETYLASSVEEQEGSDMIEVGYREKLARLRDQ